MVDRIAVIGSGQMGSGIAQVSAVAGYTVVMHDVKQEFVDKGLKGIEKGLGKLVEKEKIDEKKRDEALEHIRTTTKLDECADVDLVVEAVTEKADVKKKVFRTLDEAASKHTIFASNTSSIPITELAAATDRPGRFIGMHFMNPVPVMKLVEVIRGLETTDATKDTIFKVTESLGKTPVEVHDFPAFATNRILLPMINEAIFAYMEGVASKEDIDKCAKLGLNHPMGPFELADFVGLDTCLYVLEVLHDGYGDPKFRPCPLLRKMVQAGRLGRKSGRGFYDYS